MASFWRRFAAWLIDGIVWSFVTWPLQLGFQFAFVSSMPSDFGTGDELPPVTFFNWLAAAFDTAIAAVAIYTLAVALVSIAFEAFGWTPGKAALGMRVLRGDGALPGPVHGAARHIGKAVSGAILLLGYLWAAWDPQRQAWHDKFANTYVVMVPQSGLTLPTPPTPSSITMGARVWAGIAVFYLVGTLVTLFALAAWVPNDGATWRRFFESLDTLDSPRSDPRFPPPRNEHLDGPGLPSMRA